MAWYMQVVSRYNHRSSVKMTVMETRARKVVIDRQVAGIGVHINPNILRHQSFVSGIILTLTP